MRKHNKSRPAKKTTADRKSHKKSAAPTVTAAPEPMKLNFVATAPTQVEQPVEVKAPRRRSPLGFWTGLPFAMMRMLLGPKSTAARK
jgi:hypothetical protein